MVPSPFMLLAAVLFFGILTMWVPARWALSAFQIAIFALAAVRIVKGRESIHSHPVTWLLALAPVWGILQLAAGWTVDPSATQDAILIWLTNLCAFSLALEMPGTKPRPSGSGLNGSLQTILWFGFLLSIFSTITFFSSPAGKIAWWFDTGLDVHTLGPFVYRNQYAAFIEAILPLALFRAMLDRRRWLLYLTMAAVMFASVVASASRAGTILCGVEILTVPLVGWARGIVSGRALARVMLGTLAAVGLLTAVAGWEQVWNRLQQPDPYALRRDLLQSSIAMVHDRPLTGFGLGAWPMAYPGYARYDDGTFVNQAHNDWAQWAAEGGIPFLILMLAILAISIRPAIRSNWGIGILFVFIHCCVDYPMQQRPALAAFFFALLGSILAVKQAYPTTN